jgi:hypothetical protein
MEPTLAVRRRISSWGGAGLLGKRGRRRGQHANNNPGKKDLVSHVALLSSPPS